MPECEICGKPSDGRIAIVEGAKMQVCPQCEHLGRTVWVPQPERREEPARSRAPMEFEVIEGYGQKVKSTREKRGLSIEELAKKINEKANYLERVEHEKTLPSESLCHRLQKELGIKLMEPVGSGSGPASKSGEGGGVTLGDILEIAEKKKKDD
jgi:uncharacterized protein (TIGR00270 family)